MSHLSPHPPVAPPIQTPAPVAATGEAVAAVPTQVPFHRLARIRPRYRWWRPLLTGILAGAMYLAVVFVLGAAVAAALFATTGTVSESALLGTFDLDRPWLLLMTLAPLILLIPVFAAASRMVEGRGVGFLVSVTQQVRWRWLGKTMLIAFAVFAPFLALTVLVQALSGAPFEPRFDHPGIPVMLMLVLLFVPLQAAAEEFVFRGYLMQLVGAWLKHPAFAILLPAPLFVLGHGYDLWGGLSVGVFAVVAGWLCWRTGGLEAAISMHLANNVLLFALGAFGLSNPNATSGTAVDLMISVAMMLVFTAVVVKSSRGIERYAASASASRIV